MRPCWRRPKNSLSPRRTIPEDSPLTATGGRAVRRHPASSHSACRPPFLRTNSRLECPAAPTRPATFQVASCRNTLFCNKPRRRRAGRPPLHAAGRCRSALKNWSLLCKPPLAPARSKFPNRVCPRASLYPSRRQREAFETETASKTPEGCATARGGGGSTVRWTGFPSLFTLALTARLRNPSVSTTR